MTAAGGATRAVAGLLTALTGLGAAPPSTMRLDEVRAGLRGEALTVYSGTELTRIPLELLGVAPAFAGPGRDVVLARLEGEQALRSGVVSGMSGSPVFVEGRLLGALAYRLSAFAVEPLAAITPIEQMLPMAHLPEGEQLGSPSPEQHAAMLHGEEPLSAGLADDAPHLALAGPAFAPAIRQRFARLLGTGDGAPLLTATLARPAQDSGDGTPPLTGGDAVAAVLVQGDMALAATGTVTLVDGTGVWAFGHPLARLGAIDLPMARAAVLATVSSTAASFKMVELGATVGAFRQDRATGIFGRLGARAALLPVDVEVRAGSDARIVRRHFEVASQRALTPALLELVLANTLLTGDQGAVTGTIRMAGRLEIRGEEPVVVDNLFSAGPGSLPVAFQAARFAAGVAGALYSAPEAAPPDMSLSFRFELEPATRLLLVEDVRVSRPVIAAGSEFTVEVSLRDATRRERRVERLTLRAPLLPRGTLLEITAGDAGSATAVEGPAEANALLGRQGVRRAVSRLRSQDRLQVRLSRVATGLVRGADPLPDLPPSVHVILSAGIGSRGFPLLGRAVVAAAERQLPGVVAGSGRLTITLE